MRVLDLFSGIGGFSLGLESTGCFRTVAFCEKEEFCRGVLKKHWPDVPIYEDIHDVSGFWFRGVDVVTGGFPCQPVSLAGKRKGKADDRWLWPELFRVVREARPTWCLLENVPGLRTKHADEVLADLEEQGYACWPLVVGAVHAGAPHRRQRVWIVAYAEPARCGRERDAPDSQGERPEEAGGLRCDEPPQGAAGSGQAHVHRFCETYSVCHNPNECDGNDCWLLKHPERAPADPEGLGRPPEGERGLSQESGVGPDGQERDVAYAEHNRLQGAEHAQPGQGAADMRRRLADKGATDAPDPFSPGLEERQGQPGDARTQFAAFERGHEQWDWNRAPEPVLRGVDDGLSRGLDRTKRLKALGNAVVPQVVAQIGYQIAWSQILQ